MIIKPRQLGKESIDIDKLSEDKKNCRRFGPCGIGKRAVYLNSFYLDRIYYIPLNSVTRVFKRIAMSKGGFTGKGIFATIPYLVVEYDGGGQKQCIFKHEEQVDAFLAHIRELRPDIPVHSREAEKRLREKEKRLAEKRSRNVPEDAAAGIRLLERCREWLEKRPELYIELSAASKKKRTYDRSNPAYKWAALFITLLGAGALVYGIYALITKAGFGMYFLLFGLAAIFLFSSANVLPTARNNRRYIEKRLEKAVEEMERYVKDCPDFPVPARYGHPAVLKRMSEIMAEGRTESVEEAFAMLKEDLKALNSSVAVEQEEYDEIMAIKPMFLVRDYQ